MSTAEDLLIEARVQNVRCTDDRRLDLTDGRELSVPIRWYPRLMKASAAERADWQWGGAGYGIHWPQIDEDLSVKGMLTGRTAPGVVK